MWRFLVIFLLVCDFALAENYYDPTEIPFRDIGTVDINFRYRFGYLENDINTERGLASTLRSLIGLTSSDYYNSHFYLQFKNVTKIFGTQYNDGINNRTKYPLEPDPATTEINQLFFKNNSIPYTEFTFGRHLLNWDNQRYIGTSPWRQNNRTFDGASVESNYFKDFIFKYAYLKNVNRPIANKSPEGDYGGTFNLVNLAYDPMNDFGDLTLYAYFMNIRNYYASGLSAKTYGTRYRNEIYLNTITDGIFAYNINNETLRKLPINFDIEYAIQEDLGGMSTNFKKHYLRFEPSIYWNGLKTSFGYELISADLTNAFRFPLGSDHYFNGFSENFSTIPVTGLKDYYVKLNYEFPDKIFLLGNSQFYAAFHHQIKYKGRANYGSELDLSIKYQGDNNTQTEFSFAKFFDNSSFGDSTKFWVMFSLGI